jgi:hypothetical protein
LASVSRLRRPPSAKRTAALGSYARPTQTSSTQASFTARIRLAAPLSHPKPPSISRSASGITLSRARKTLPDDRRRALHAPRLPVLPRRSGRQRRPHLQEQVCAARQRRLARSLLLEVR